MFQCDNDYTKHGVKGRQKTILPYDMSVTQLKPVQYIEMCRNAEAKEHITLNATGQVLLHLVLFVIWIRMSST